MKKLTILSILALCLPAFAVIVSHPYPTNSTIRTPQVVYMASDTPPVFNAGDTSNSVVLIVPTRDGHFSQLAVPVATYFATIAQAIPNTNALTAAQLARLNAAVTNGSAANGTYFTNLTATYLDSTAQASVNGLITTALANNGSITATISNNVLTLQITNSSVKFPVPLSVQSGGHSLTLSTNSIFMDGFKIFSANNTNLLYASGVSTNGQDFGGYYTNCVPPITNGGMVIYYANTVSAVKAIGVSNGVTYLLGNVTSVPVGMTNSSFFGTWTHNGYFAGAQHVTNFMTSYAVTRSVTNINGVDYVAPQ